MKQLHAYLGWIALAAALLACAAVAYLAWTIEGGSTERAKLLKSAEAASSKQAAALRAHALAKDTESDRKKLSEIVRPDLLAVADMIEAAGKTAGVAVELSQAIPENASKEVEALGVRPVGFAVQADGTFARLMHAAELFEALPLSSQVTRLDIEHVGASDVSAGDWHMNIYIRVLTAADI
jgi:hypothetical protein